MKYEVRKEYMNICEEFQNWIKESRHKGKEANADSHCGKPVE